MRYKERPADSPRAGKAETSPSFYIYSLISASCLRSLILKVDTFENTQWRKVKQRSSLILKWTKTKSVPKENGTQKQVVHVWIIYLVYKAQLYWIGGRCAGVVVFLHILI